MIKFPEINQFRHCVYQVRRRAEFSHLDEDGEPVLLPDPEWPVLKFHGTTKLHGTNASVCQMEAEGVLVIQSRNNVITAENDNAGFARWVESQPWWFDVFKEVRDYFNVPIDQAVTVYGEWCGKGIQKGVAVNELDKQWAVFAVRVGDGDGGWRHPEQIGWPAPIECIGLFSSWVVEIDFSNPAEAQNSLVAITESVEAECPYAAAHGVKGTGEGVVWRCITEGWESSKFWFKVKGEKHSATKVKTMAPVDVEKMASVTEFVDAVVTDARCEQGIDYLNEQGMELSRKSTGAYLSWVFGDVMKEEADTLEASGLTKKDVSKRISEKARRWFFVRVETVDGV